MRLLGLLSYVNFFFPQEENSNFESLKGGWFSEAGWLIIS